MDLRRSGKVSSGGKKSRVTHKMSARLIINADDFGLTQGINRAVAELYCAGALTSATLMATGEAFAEAVSIAQENSGLGVGCHVVLTDGVPVCHPSEIPTLIGSDGKTFRPSLLDLSQAVLRGQVREDDVIREAFAQVQKLQRAGIDVTHLDAHKHAHLFPVITRCLLHVARRCNVGAIRNPFEAGWAMGLGHGGKVRRLSMRLLDQGFRRRFQTQVASSNPLVATTDGALAVSTTGSLTSTTLSEILKAIPDTGVWELVVHPGYNDQALTRVTTRLRGTRDTEREALFEHIPRLAKNPSSPQLIHYGSLGPFGRLREIGQFTPFNGYEKVL